MNHKWIVMTLVIGAEERDRDGDRIRSTDTVLRSSSFIKEDEIREHLLQMEKKYREVSCVHILLHEQAPISCLQDVYLSDSYSIEVPFHPEGKDAAEAFASSLHVTMKEVLDALREDERKQHEDERKKREEIEKKRQEAYERRTLATLLEKYGKES